MQIIFKDVIEIACDIPGLIDTVYEGMIEIFGYFVNDDLKFNLSGSLLSQTLMLLFGDSKKKFGFMKEIVQSLKCDTVYIMKPISVNYLSNSTNILSRLRSGT